MRFFSKLLVIQSFLVFSSAAFALPIGSRKSPLSLKGPLTARLPARVSSKRTAATVVSAHPSSALNVVENLRGGSFATTVAPAIGATIANAMFASGFSAVAAKRQEGKLGDFNAIPMPLMFGNCVGWLAYSFINKDPYVACANIPGLLLGTWYTLTTIRIAEPNVSNRIETVMMAMVAIHLAAATTSAFFLPDREAMSSLYGMVNNAILLAYYGAPLSTIGKVLSEKNSDSIYFPTVLINGINGVFWSVYALAIKDTYMLIPNAIGASLAAVQALLCLMFGKSK
jgi:solute carrier family 50 protein (sugar transporter)